METELKRIVDKKGNTIRIEVGEIPLLITEKEKSWIAYSPQFKTLGYSKKSAEDSVEEFGKSIDVFFAIHTQKGTLEGALIHFGWEKQNNVFTKPKFFNDSRIHGGIEPYPYQLAAG